MRVEHIALQVRDSVVVAKWYVEHLGFRLVRMAGGPAQTHFVADDAGTIVFEIYSHPDAPQPDYASMHPLQLHIALMVEDVSGIRDRLLGAGAAHVSGPETSPSGDELAMLRDPWGLPLQLVSRKTPLLPR